MMMEKAWEESQGSRGVRGPTNLKRGKKPQNDHKDVQNDHKKTLKDCRDMQD